MDDPLPPAAAARPVAPDVTGHRLPARHRARRVDGPTTDSERFFTALAHAAARLSGSLDRNAIFRIVVSEVAEALAVDAVTVRIVVFGARDVCVGEHAGRARVGRDTRRMRIERG